MTETDYNELRDARDWARLNGMPGLVTWYTEKLADQAKRRALPAGCPEMKEAAESNRVANGGRGNRDRDDSSNHDEYDSEVRRPRVEKRSERD